MATVSHTPRQRWQRDTLEPTLKRSPERAASFTTISGRPIDRLYSADDVTSAAAAAAQTPAGQFPYLRGIHEGGYRGKPWTMRQFAGFGTPEQTNARYKLCWRRAALA